jgi:hypothetical protein
MDHYNAIDKKAGENRSFELEFHHSDNIAPVDSSPTGSSDVSGQRK